MRVADESARVECEAQGCPRGVGTTLALHSPATHPFNRDGCAQVGAVVEGMEVLVAVAKTPVNKKKQPETKTGLTIDVQIADCGQLPEDACRTREEEELSRVAALELQDGGVEGAADGGRSSESAREG